MRRKRFTSIRITNSAKNSISSTRNKLFSVRGDNSQAVLARAVALVSRAVNNVKNDNAKVH
jgi:hypothetical protein